MFYGGINNTIHSYNLVTGAEDNVFKGHTDTITGLALSHSGKYLVSNSMDNTVRVWDVSPFVVGDSRLVKTLKSQGQHNFEMNLIRTAWSHDDSKIVVGSADNNAYVWDTDTGELIHSIAGHLGAVTDVAFHPQTDILATASRDKTVIIGNL